MSIEEPNFIKYSMLDHILMCPDTYIGDTTLIDRLMCIYNNNHTEENPKIIQKEITYSPALYKICDEIFLNVHDHCKRCNSCDTMVVGINQKLNTISVWNNGDGIDIIRHNNTDQWVPTMLFGQLLTSTNYDQKYNNNNGLSAKLTNIFSKEFIVETLDSKRGKSFRQRFYNNMRNSDEPVVTDAPNKKSYTKISFKPDLERFGLENLSDDFVLLIKKRAYDMAMLSDLNVYFITSHGMDNPLGDFDIIYSENEHNIDTASYDIYFCCEKIGPIHFESYVDSYFPSNYSDSSERDKIISRINPYLWMMVIYDQNKNINLEQISFVNGVSTPKGGSHIDELYGCIYRKIKEICKNRDIKQKQIKKILQKNFIFFVDADINPITFYDQLKEGIFTKQKLMFDPLVIDWVVGKIMNYHVQ